MTTFCTTYFLLAAVRVQGEGRAAAAHAEGEGEGAPGAEHCRGWNGASEHHQTGEDGMELHVRMERNFRTS